MLIPCIKGEKSCTPCAGDSSNPFANLTIEPNDRNIWLSVYFPPLVKNPTPNNWTADACVGFCESAISQLDADDCAKRKAADCNPDTTDDPQPPDPPLSPTLFCNQEITAQSGSNCYTMPACTVFSPSQSGANAIAQSMADSRVLNSALSSPCAPIIPPPGPEPEPPVEPDECVPCCNCGAVVSIQDHNPALFTFDPASMDSVNQYNIPDDGTRNLTGTIFDVPENGWFSCTGDDLTTFGFFKQGGNWFQTNSAGFCVPIIDIRLLTYAIEAYPAGVLVDGLVNIKKNPYDLGFGTGEWNGQFALTDDAFNICAVQHFPTKHISGYGGFTVELEATGAGPSFLWTLTFRQYYHNGDVSPRIVLWVGERTGTSQCGTYTRVSGEVFTGPASLNIVAVP